MLNDVTLHLLFIMHDAIPFIKVLSFDVEFSKTKREEGYAGIKDIYLKRYSIYAHPEHNALTNTQLKTISSTSINFVE